MRERGLILRYPLPGWAGPSFDALLPGGHACVFGLAGHALEAEDAGFEVRDCLTVLGPSAHRVWLLRRPCESSTVAGQVLSTGTGGLCIDACRVQHGEPDRPTALSSAGKFAGNAYAKDKYSMSMGVGKQENRGPTPEGRWPANLVLVHTHGCVQDGVKRVSVQSGGAGNYKRGAASERQFNQCPTTAVTNHRDLDGLEVVQAWVCQPGCPVLALDAQSGVLTSGRMDDRHVRSTSKGWSGPFKDDLGGPATRSVFSGDAGGASRFFPQFASEDELDTWLTRLILGPDNQVATV